MKKIKPALIAGVLLISLGIFTGALRSESMQLVNIQSNQVIVEFHGETAAFKDPFLEAVMKEDGILIPPPLRNEYNGKKVVYLGDKEFSKAFKEVYYKISINNETHKWK